MPTFYFWMGSDDKRALLCVYFIIPIEKPCFTIMKNIIVNERPPEKHQMDYFLHETLFIKEELLEWKNERDRKKEERDKKEKEEGEKRLELRRCQIIINIESFLEDLKEKKIIEKYDDSLLWKLELYDLLPLEGSHLKNIK